MADPRVFDTLVAVAQDEALASLLVLLADDPDAQEGFAERYGNPYLEPHSATTLVEAAANDHQVRAAHGQAIMMQAAAHALTAQQKRIEELEAKLAERSGPEVKPEASAKPEPKKGAAKAKR